MSLTTSEVGRHPYLPLLTWTIDSDQIQSQHFMFSSFWTLRNKLCPLTETFQSNMQTCFPERERLDLSRMMRTPFSCPCGSKSELSLVVSEQALQAHILVL